MDGVWHLNAPQWTDFASSPQIPDDNYFERNHDELEPQPLIDEVSAPAAAASVPAEKKESKAKENTLEVPGKDDSLINEIEIAKMTPVKVVSPRSRKKNNPAVKETTYDNVLSEAMASLQLSVKKKARRSHSAQIMLSNLTATPTTVDKIAVSKSLNLIHGTRSTPSNPIPMWIRKKRPSENNLEQIQKTLPLPRNDKAQGETEQANLLPQETQNKEDATTGVEKLVDIDIQPNVEDLCNKDEPKLAQISNEPKEFIDAYEGNDMMPKKSAPPCGSGKGRSNVSQRSSYSNKMQLARFSTCQLRRRSLTQYRRRSNKYVSLAEAICKFQTGTPKRFRSVSSKNTKPGPLQKVRQSSVSATVPISPALRCKSRTRPTTVLSQEERERLEIAEIRKHSVRENLARANSLKSLAPNLASKPSRTKSTTDSEPINLSETKGFNANMEKKVNRETRLKVTVPSFISTDEGMAVKDAEISNFGVPDITTAKPTTTKVIPFSFETRNKEMQMKKEKKMKELMTEEEKKIKVPFHARPVPAFKKPMLAATKETNAPKPKPKTKTCPFSFEERDKNLMKKRENFIKTVLEEDKKARIFQAKPIPEFKPVLVRGTSKENINSGNKPPSHAAPQKSRISMLPVSKTGSRNCLLVKANVFNQENQNPSVQSGLPIPKQEKSKSKEDKNEPQSKTTTKVLAEFHLNTDKRAKERREFDNRIKQKEQEIESLRKEAEEENLKRNEAERAEIRRMAEIKARPMPAYKPLAVIHSNKPLTEPQSPGWATKPKG